MTKLKQFKKLLLSSKGQKISLTILLIGIFFFAPTFAVETNTQTSEILTKGEYVIRNLIQILSRSWIVLATLAGKFMTNDMVYGTWLHLDIYLWKLRNICKNFANFALLGVLLREIIQFIKNKTGNIQGAVTKAVIAGVLIQASWFIMAILLDISSIATAAISSFPTHFIDSNALSKQTIGNEIAENMKAHTYILDKEGNLSEDVSKDNTNQPTLSIEQWIEKIMPKNDSVAGPLVYIGASTLKIQNAINRPQQLEPNVKNVFTTSLLQFLAIAIYCITLILLLITNIIRIGLLWVIIPISPILILMFALKKEGKEGIAENFSISVILNAIFKPVLFAGALSLVLIFIVSMQNIMTTGNNNSFTIQGTTFSSSGSLATMEVNELSKTTINDSVFTQAGNMGKNIFSNIIIYFSTIFLLRYLVKEAAKFGGGTIGKVMDSSTQFVENMAKTTPIIAGKSAGAYMDASNQALANIGKSAGIDLNTNLNDIFSGNISSTGSIKNEKYEKRLEEMMGAKQRESTDFSNLSSKKNINGFLNETKSIIQDKSLSFKNNQESFKKRESILNEKFKTEDASIIRQYFKGGTKEYNLSNMSDDGFKKLHNELGGSGVEPKNYTDFKNIVYGKVE